MAKRRSTFEKIMRSVERRGRYSPVTLWRLMRGLSQPQLARLLGVSQASVSLWELGKRTPDIETQARVANLLGVSAEQLFGEGGEG